MACTISLPLWPQAINCISWSKENLIAVAGGDQIAILTPRLTTPGQNGTFWDASIIKANEFNEQEVPLEDPLSFRNFSVAEELSSRHVHTLEWSPPGISRFGGCLLSVLSANHVLSLWGCEGAANVDSNWKRKIIINHALKAHYSRTASDQDLTDREMVERRQVQQRVRAFTWAPTCPVPDGQHSRRTPPSPGTTSRQQYLAVSAEAREILILRVRSPYNILVPSSDDYDIEVLHSFSAGCNGLAKNNVGVGSPYTRHGLAESLAWSDWMQETSGDPYAHLAYISNGSLFFQKLVLDFTTPDPQISIVWSHPRKLLSAPMPSMRGPLKFAPKSGLLVAFAPDRIFCVDTTASSIDNNSLTSHHLDDRWDEISGIAFTQPNNSITNVHIASHLSSAAAPTAVLSLPFSEDGVSTSPMWQQAINANRASFSAQHGLAGNVDDRVCGIASSPLGDYIITASTMEPSDCVVYSILSEQKAILNISSEVSLLKSSVLELELPSDTAEETMLFGLQQLAVTEGSEVNMKQALQAMMSKVYTTNRETDPAPDSLRTSQQDVSWLVKDLRQQIYAHPGVQTERANFLLDFVYKVSPKANQILRFVLERLVDTVLSLSIDLAPRASVSARIRANYALIKLKLQPGSNLDSEGLRTESVAEQCRICHKAVALESLKWATCESGHQFSRCALTFFAIQEPGISKRCTICGMQYLNEWLMPELARADDPDHGTAGISGCHERNNAGVERGNDAGQSVSNSEDVSVSETREPALSLARLLFAAFDRCIYCGGTFVA